MFKDVGIIEKVLKVVIEEFCKGKCVIIYSVENSYNVLGKYVVNFNEMVCNGKFDLVIGWEDEICCVLYILACCIKNNFILIGEFGVGKMVIIEGLAYCIVDGDVLEDLCDKDIFFLDMGVLIVGAKYQGEFEECFKFVINEVKMVEGQIFFFIDEIYILVGVGKGQGVMDVVNILKFVLVRGELCVIGVIIFNEY